MLACNCFRQNQYQLTLRNSPSDPTGSDGLTRWNSVPDFLINVSYYSKSNRMKYNEIYAWETDHEGYKSPSYTPCILSPPITVAARSKAWNVARSNTGIVCSIPTQGMDACLC
jgi:hypothetical protein